MKEKIINLIQIGSVENHRTKGHIFTLKSIISKRGSATRQGRLYVCFVDFKKAYDTVWHEGLFTKLSKVNVKGQFLKLIESLYRQSCCAVKIGKFRTEFMLCEKDVRQGCLLSPILFNLYTNDLLNNLHHTNPNAVKLTNDVKLTCLTYADDIIIISHSALGLQASLHCLDKFCEVWKMIINTTKTKCITFQNKNKLNKTELFTVGNCILSNVLEFTYLGIKVNASGSFRSTPKFLGEKANRACFALNNHLKVRNIPVVIALKLFDATVLPILTYGAEVWTRDTYESWDLRFMEQLHLNFCEHILGVNRSTTNLLCRAELGRRPIILIIDLKILQFFKHCLNLSDDKVVKEALKAEEGLYTNYDTIKLFSKYISDTETIFDNDFSQLPIAKQKAKLYSVSGDPKW